MATDKAHGQICKYVFVQKRLLSLLSFKSCNACGKNVYEQLSTSTTKLHGKISAQLHTTLCIQFLDRDNNDINNTLPLGKQICFTIAWRRVEILPESLKVRKTFKLTNDLHLNSTSPFSTT